MSSDKLYILYQLKLHIFRILVISDGEIVEFDKPEVLEKNEKSYFHDLWKEALKEHSIH